MPNGQYPNIFAGQGGVASLIQALAPFGAYKTGDTSRATNTTLSADPDLSFAVAASGWYFFLLFVKYEGGTQGSADLKIGWSVPTGTTMAYGRIALNTSGAADVGTPTDQTGTPTFGSNGAGNPRTLFAFGTLTASTTPGTASFEWAQGTSNGVATIVHKGSGLIAVRLA